MNTLTHRTFYVPISLSLLLVVTGALFAGVARADPPSSIARLSYVSGAVSFSPAGEDEWVSASTSRPLIPSDRMWVPGGSRADTHSSSPAGEKLTAPLT